MNPYRRMPIYTLPYVELYKNKDRDSSLEPLPPHVFAVAGAAYDALVAKKTKNQAIIIRYLALVTVNSASMC
jgi:myosin heavy subunit